MKWIPIEERTPESGDIVIVYAKGMRWSSDTFCATWLDAKSEVWDGENDGGFDESSCEYIEELDSYFYPKGWYGVGFYEGMANNWYQKLNPLDYEVTHWMPLPDHPGVPLGSYPKSNSS